MASTSKTFPSRAHRVLVVLAAAGKAGPHHNPILARESSPHASLTCRFANPPGAAQPRGSECPPTHRRLESRRAPCGSGCGFRAYKDRRHLRQELAKQYPQCLHTLASASTVSAPSGRLIRFCLPSLEEASPADESCGDAPPRNVDGNARVRDHPWLGGDGIPVKATR